MSFTTNIQPFNKPSNILNPRPSLSLIFVQNSLNMKSTLTLFGALMLLTNGFAQTVLYSNDFSSTTAWTIDNDGQTAADYGWSIDNSVDSWYLNSFASTSGGNFAELSNGDPTVGNQASNVTYTMTLNTPLNVPSLPGNTTNSDNVSLQYEQAGARFNDEQLTQVSTDGVNWITVRSNADHHDVLSAQGGSPYPNPELVTVNLAPYIQGNANSVQIRFLWTTAFPASASNPNVWITYGWLIDDVKILSNPAHDMKIYNAHVNGLSNGGVHYGRTPIAQLDPLGYEILVDVSNEGTQAQTNVNFQATFGTLTASDSEANFPSLDSISLIDTLMIPATAAVYQGNFVLTSDNETSGPTFHDNEHEQNFAVTQSVYSVDGIGLHPVGTESISNYTVQGGSDIVSYYMLHQSMTLTTIRVMLSPQTQFGAEVAGKLYQVDGFGDIVYFDETSSIFISNQDINNGYVDIAYPNTLQPGEYFVGLTNYSFSETVTVLIDRTIPQPNSTTLLYDGGTATWFFIEGAAAIRLVNDDCPSFIATTVTSEDACFDGLGGSITVSASGATGPYTYDWGNGITGATLNNVAAGTYSVTITETSGCNPKQFEFTIDPRPEMDFSYNVTPATCNAISDGAATATVIAGGVQPISYTWSNGTQAPSITNVASDTYTFDAIDNEGCLGQGSVFIPANTPNFGLDFSADVTVGLAPQTVVFTNSTPNLADFTYNWNFGDGNQTASNDATVNHVYQNVGLYSVQLEATEIASGCVSTFERTSYIDIPSGLGLNDLSSNAFSLHPNPSKGSFVLTQSSNENFAVNVLDANGALIQSSTHSGQQTTFDLSHLPQGVYFLQLTQAGQVEIVRYVKL